MVQVDRTDLNGELFFFVPVNCMIGPQKKTEGPERLFEEFVVSKSHFSGSWRLGETQVLWGGGFKVSHERN